MKKSILAISIGAIVSAAGVFVLYSGTPEAAPKEQAKPASAASITVGVVHPEEAAFARTIAATGTINARDELAIGSDASGVRLLEVLVDVGSEVQKGQLLARADDALLQAQHAQQTAVVKQAQAEQEQALSNLERAERMNNFFSPEALQNRRTAAATASAKVELAVAQLGELQVRIAQTRVFAPAAGVISRKSATVGAVVQPGAELFRLMRQGQVEWRAELPSHSLAQIQPGAAARILLDNGDVLHSEVRLVAPTMDSATRNGLVYVSLPKAAGLKAGGYARGEILLEQARGLSVPEASVVTRDGNAFVFALTEDSIARLTPVSAGARHRGRVEIRAGLRLEDRIVGTGAGFVKDGDLVRVSQ
jgi:RND family efflux transporter MFP subunit